MIDSAENFLAKFLSRTIFAIDRGTPSAYSFRHGELMRLADETSGGAFSFPDLAGAISFPPITHERARLRRASNERMFAMPKNNEEFVDFTARDGVTIYTARGVTGHKAGTTVRLPKSHADALSHVAHHAAGPAKLTD
jgi:hypothetical protein